MRLVILFTIFVFANLKAFSQNTIGDKILGVWLSETKEGKIQVYRIGNRYFGKLIWSNQMFEADGKTSKKAK